MPIFIDGHNAMGALRVRGADHEAARHALLRRVHERAPDATVFFDARNAPPGVPRTFREEGVRVVYCDDREADDEILDAVATARDPGALVVVTNDRELAGRSRQLGARIERVSVFFARRPGTQPPESKPTPRGRFRAEDFGLPEEIDLDDPGPDLV